MKVLRTAFKKPLADEVASLVSSVNDDQFLIEADIEGSLAHVETLRASKLITEEQHARLKQGLTDLSLMYKEGTLTLLEEFEDVHMNVEKQLETLIGETAKHLHTARSRNDQVALDLRIYTAKQAQIISQLLADLVSELETLVSRFSTIVLPGYTHMQRAQPITFEQSIGAFKEALLRDVERIDQARERARVSPLGAAALAGTALALQKELTAATVGFDRVFANTVDAVSDRDFACDFVFATTMIGIHLSQMAETLIIWATSEFGFVQLDDSFTTTSSLMPQKKNPDPLEIIRAKSGVLMGELVSLLSVLKGLPQGYNRDLQETKPQVIKAARIVVQSLKVMCLAMPAISINQQRCAKAVSDPELYATDLVEHLVLKGVPFRQAHELVASLVQYARDNGKNLAALDLDEYQRFHPSFAGDVFTLFDPVRSAQSRVKA